MAGIIVPIGADASGFNQVVNGLPEKVAKASKGMNAAGAMGGLSNMLGGLSVAAGVAGLRKMTNEMDDLADTALRLGESTEVIQRVAYASNILAGVDAEGISSAFLKLEKALGDPNNAAGAAALDHLGLSAQKLANMPLDQKVLAMGEAFVKARATGTGYNDILALLGRSAGELIPLFEQATEAKRLMSETHVISDAEVQRMAQINDQLDGYIMRAKSWATEAAASIAGILDNINWKQDIFDKDWTFFNNEKLAQDQIERDIKSQQARPERTLPKADTSKATMDAAEASDKSRADAIRASKDKIAKEEKNRADIASRLNDLASKNESKMQDLISSAFSPLKGDADISTGRGSNYNPLTKGASTQLQQMAAQTALMRKTAATLDKSAAHLANIDAQIRKMDAKVAYN
jgi:hypothetical protein